MNILHLREGYRVTIRAQISAGLRLPRPVPLPVPTCKFVWCSRRADGRLGYCAAHADRVLDQIHDTAHEADEG